MTSQRPRIYFVRHGETEWNAADRLLSRTDDPINARGLRQAEALARDLADIRWDRAFTSPLVRASRTAEIILAAGASPPPVVSDDRLLEMDFGAYEGRSAAQLEADPLAITRRRDGAQLPGVESEAEVEARGRSFLGSLGDVDGTTLVVGHGRMLRILIATAILGQPASMARRLRMRNSRPAIVEPGHPPLLLGFNVGAAGDEAMPQ